MGTVVETNGDMILDMDTERALNAETAEAVHRLHEESWQESLREMRTRLHWEELVGGSGGAGLHMLAGSSTLCMHEVMCNALATSQLGITLEYGAALPITYCLIDGIQSQDSYAEKIAHELLQCCMVLRLVAHAFESAVSTANPAVAYIGRLGHYLQGKRIMARQRARVDAALVSKQVASSEACFDVSEAYLQAPLPSEGMYSRLPDNTTAAADAKAGQDSECAARKARIARQEALFASIQATRTENATTGAGLQASLNMLRGRMAANGLVTVLQGTEDADSGLVPALCDDGASFSVSCTRSIDGAVPGSYSDKDAESLSVGNKNSALRSLGSYLFVLERFAANGSKELVLRRMKHTPDLHLPMVISEPTEVYGHQYKIAFDAKQGRVFTSNTGQELPLFMNSVKLGWLKVRKVVDTATVAAILKTAVTAHAAAGHGVVGPSQLMPIGQGESRSVGMPTAARQLTGVELLRREHVASGHLSLRRLLIKLQADGLPSGRVTKADVAAFAKAGCGICESTKMKRRAFTLSTPPLDNTPPPIGKVWVADELSLKIPSAQHGFTRIYLAVCRTSGKRFVAGMEGETAADVRKAEDELRNFNRPHHGELWITRKDSLPAHRSREHAADSAAANTHRQLSPPGVHEGVGPAENGFLHGTPLANAFLLQTDDLGDNHFYAAFQCAIAAQDFAPSGDDAPQTSANMRYYRKTEWLVSPLYAFGSVGKAFIHQEFRTGKQGDEGMHAYPCVYTGPAMNSDSLAHCSVWHGAPGHYTDVDVGLVHVDERGAVARSERTHPAHQPYGQCIVETDKNMPAVASSGPTAGGAHDPDGIDGLPYHAGTVWLLHHPPPTQEFTIGYCCGHARPGDVASWCSMLSGGLHVHVRIDEHVGGYEHRVDREDVHTALLLLVSHDKCKGIFEQITCGPWSAVKFEGGTDAQGRALPKPIFLWPDAVDGVKDADGSIIAAAAHAMRSVHKGVELGDRACGLGKLFISEHPAGHGAGALLAVRGLEAHSTMHDTTPFAALRAKHGLVSVWLDQGAAGHDKRKTTELLSDACTADELREHVGTLHVADSWVSATPPLRGKNEDGTFRTRGAETYPPPVCEKLARSILQSSAGGDNAQNTNTAKRSRDNNSRKTAEYDLTKDLAAIQSAAETPGVDDYTRGDRIDVYWENEKQWYSGRVVNAGVSRVRINGKQVSVPDLQVKYDDGKLVTHARHNNSGIRISDEPTLYALTAERALYDKDTQASDILKELDEQADALNNTQSLEVLSQNESMHLHHIQAGDALANIDWHATGHGSEFYSIVDIQIDLEDGELLNKSSVFVVDTNGVLTKAASLDTANARYWHTPTNERDFQRSPQHDLWAVAKQLKWDKYISLNMFEWVLVSSIDRKKHQIYNTLWAYKIKLEEGLKFSKLNPRWCLKGGTMDRGQFKAHAETLRMTSYRIILACKAGYWHAFAEFLLDCSDAFQSTRTDGSSSVSSAPLYCFPAPGFEKKAPNGERMCCKVMVAMQGRIDATRLFNTNLFAILVEKAGMMRCGCCGTSKLQSTITILMSVTVNRSRQCSLQSRQQRTPERKKSPLGTQSSDSTWMMAWALHAQLAGIATSKPTECCSSSKEQSK